MRYQDYLAPYIDGAGRLTDFLELREGRLIFGGALDVLELARQHGAPLEISYCPQITRRVQAMQQLFDSTCERTGFRGGFVYAYATKANFSEEVVRTAIAAGAHYETSSAFDVRIAHQLWRDGKLPAERFIFCNGSKEQPYLDAILELRRAGFARIVPILDDLEEFEALAGCPEPLLLGVRERKDAGDLAAGITYGYDRFGLLPEEMEALAARVAGTPHRIVAYHAMVGSQLEDSAHFIYELLESLQGYARLHALAPTLDHFNFGGGMPTGAYNLDFSFDYHALVETLQRQIGEWCSARGVPHPTLIGEFGRYTVADHGVHIFRVGRVKHGHPGSPTWYLLDGSLMVALPDILIVAGQQFICLALNHHEREARPVVLGGRRTCDSDDFYPRSPETPLLLPAIDEADEPLLLAFFGTGAYQAMLSGEGGAHHCLAPEAPKLVIEERGGEAVSTLIAEQTWDDVLTELGYR
jgi:arginine decarboxylase